MSAKRTLLLSILFAALFSFSGMASPAHARGYVSIGIQVGGPPPPLRYEYVPVRPRYGYTWVGGYWHWRPAYRSYVWVPGYWARPPRPHAVWIGPRYYHRHHHHYYRHGYWRY